MSRLASPFHSLAAAHLGLVRRKQHELAFLQLRNCCYWFHNSVHRAFCWTHPSTAFPFPPATSSLGSSWHRLKRHWLLPCFSHQCARTYFATLGAVLGFRPHQGNFVGFRGRPFVLRAHQSTFLQTQASCHPKRLTKSMQLTPGRRTIQLSRSSTLQPAATRALARRS
jgi:hypothetical protein